MFEKYNIGIMGTGNIAGIMADTIKKMKGVKLYAVASRTRVKQMPLRQSMAVRRLMIPMKIWFLIRK